MGIDLLEQFSQRSSMQVSCHNYNVGQTLWSVYTCFDFISFKLVIIFSFSRKNSLAL